MVQPIAKQISDNNRNAARPVGQLMECFINDSFLDYDVKNALGYERIIERPLEKASVAATTFAVDPFFIVCPVPLFLRSPLCLHA